MLHTLLRIANLAWEASFYRIAIVYLVILFCPRISQGVISQHHIWDEIAYPAFTHQDVDGAINVAVKAGTDGGEAALNVSVTYSVGVYANKESQRIPRPDMFTLSMVMSNGELIHPCRNEFEEGVIYRGTCIQSYTFRVPKSEGIFSHLRITIIDTTYLCVLPSFLIVDYFPDFNPQKNAAPNQNMIGGAKPIEWERITYRLQSGIEDIALSLCFRNDMDDVVADLILQPKWESSSHPDRWDLFSHRTTLHYEVDGVSYRTRPVLLSLDTKRFTRTDRHVSFKPLKKDRLSQMAEVCVAVDGKETKISVPFKLVLADQ